MVMVQDVRELNSSFTNGMETFWVAETLKYFWLLFGPDDVLGWDQVILNTEVGCLLGCFACLPAAAGPDRAWKRLQF